MEQEEIDAIDPAMHNFIELLDEPYGCAIEESSQIEPTKSPLSMSNNGVLEDTSSGRKVNETRVITLDTIIRKGLVERMPMTAKDIDNIVPNALQKERERQDADNQRKKRLAEEKAAADIIESSDDEVSSEYDSLKNANVNDDNVNEAMLEDPLSTDVEHGNGDRVDEVTDQLIEPPVIVDAERLSPDRSGSVSPLLKPMTEIPNVAFSVNADQEFINEMAPATEGNANDATYYSEESDSDTESLYEDSASDSSSSNVKAKKRRRKSTTKVVASTSLTVGDAVIDRPINKRGRPRKIRPPEEQCAIKISEKKTTIKEAKALFYNGPKRKRGRPKRDDGMACYPNYVANAKSTVTTPMDELRAMGHSLFSDYGGSRQINRTSMQDSFELMSDDTVGPSIRPQDLLEISEVIPSSHRAEMQLLDDHDDGQKAPMPVDGMLQVQHSAVDNNRPVVFRRKPGRPKIDRESGGQIVFQNSELTVVNKFNKSIKTEMDERQASSSTVSQDSFDETQQNANSYQMHASSRVKSEIEIVPIASTTNRFVLPKDTTIQASGSRKPYKNVTVLNFGDGSSQMQPSSSAYRDHVGASVDDMLEVRRVDGFDALHPMPPKKRGPKPKMENYYARNLYADYSKRPVEVATGFSEPKKRGRKPKSLFAPMNEPASPRPITSTPTHSRPSISLKNINDLLAVPSTVIVAPPATNNDTTNPAIPISTAAAATTTTSTTTTMSTATTSSTSSTTSTINATETTGKRIRKPKNMDFPYELTPPVRRTMPVNQQLQIQRLPFAGSIHDPMNVKQQQFINRDKRASGNRPKYAEWSESSSDNQDDASAKSSATSSNQQNISKQTTNPYSIQIKPMKSGKLHWKTQLKVQRMLREGINLPLEIINQSLPAIQQQHKLQLQQQQQQHRLNHSAPLPDVDITMVKREPKESHALDFSMENVEVTPDITIDEEHEHHRRGDDDDDDYSEDLDAAEESFESKKRIPKLKFDSFNFNERRDKFSNKPRMVLKYKKKYKKKPKLMRPMLMPPTTMMIMGADGVPVPVNASNGNDVVIAHEMVRQKWARKQQHAGMMQAAVTKVKRKYTKRNLAGGVIVAEAVVTKNAAPDRCDSGLDPATAGDLPSSSKIHEENKVLQDRNKILLEILEQRSAEIRNLKLRVSNMVKTSADEETEGGEASVVAANVATVADTVPRDDETAWSQAELAKAYSLQKLSRPLYAYVQSRFSLPLPPPTEIGRYVSELSVSRGVLQQWVQILEFDGETMTEMDRVTVLQISQVPLRPVYEYDIDVDTIVGPHRTLTIIVARGLYSGWAQAVFAEFDATDLKASLRTVIEELHKIKFPVVACACKYTANVANDTTTHPAWTELGISAGCNYFSHPVTTDFIYAFYYMDDMLLTMHQYFLSNGFAATDADLQCSTARSSIERLLRTGRSSLPITDAILQPHVDIKQAVRLFCGETATLLRGYLADDDAAIACAKHLDVIGAFYQLMSSKCNDIDDDKDDMPQSKQPYGKNLEYQNNILNEIQLHFYKFRSAGSPQMTEFQRATMQSIESLKMLQHSTKQRYKVDSFSTANITGEYLHRKRLAVSTDNTTTDGSSTELLTPLRAFRAVKEIFLHPMPRSDDDHMAMPNETCFYEADMDAKAHSEAHYVQLLIEWIAEKYKDKHPYYDEFVGKMNKIEEKFVTIQGDKNFSIVEGAVTSVFKKIKSHKFGMFLEVIHTFVVQRHLLRIKYFNAIEQQLTEKA